ncbi:MAG: T9SS type A sorting domain-containing protein [Bacteroidetes bacterium]|nr:T9SS type A sorting domain-containing protein [Bacteroidota bacterium]
METGDSTEASIWKVELPAKNACPVQPAVSEEKIFLNTDENYEEQKVLLFPNPAYDKFYIDNMDNAENLQMMIYNSTGQLILKRMLEEGITTSDTDKIPTGLYTVIIFDDNNFLYREEMVIE